MSVDGLSRMCVLVVVTGTAVQYSKGSIKVPYNGVPYKRRDP